MDPSEAKRLSQAMPLSFGGLLRAFRDQHQLTQVLLAQKLGLTSAALCDLETGRRLASARRALAIAEKLELDEKQVLALALRDLIRREGRNYAVVVGAAQAEEESC